MISEENIKEYRPSEELAVPIILRNEVEAVLSKTKNNKSPGSDHVVTEMMKTQSELMIDHTP